MQKILNQAQAEAVYSAMCSLNNISGVINVCFPLDPGIAGKRGFVTVRENVVGQIEIIHEMETIARHESQSAFATAYGLQQG